MGQVTGTPPDVPGALYSTAVARIAELEAENQRLREAAEDVYGPWSCGEPLDREMRELGRVIGMTLDPA